MALVVARRFEPARVSAAVPAAPGPRALLGASGNGLLVRAAAACLTAGFVLLGFLAHLPAELWER